MIGFLVFILIWIGIFLLFVCIIYGIAALIGLFMHRKILTFKQAILVGLILVSIWTMMSKHKTGGNKC